MLFFAEADGASFVQCGDERWPVVAFAIAHYPGTSTCYLFSLDGACEVIGDSDCASVAEAMELAESSHRVQKHVWKAAS